MRLVIYGLIFVAGVIFAYKFPEQGHELVTRADIVLNYAHALIQK
ncbi:MULTISPECIES: hypothetical protein [Photobacterium]|nr:MULTISPECIES: hypothetical protein [Photobacterium]